MSEELYFNDELRKCLNAAGLSDCGENDAWNYWYQRVHKAHDQAVDRVTEAQRAENAKLREEFDKMDVWHSKELTAAMDENAKLREELDDQAGYDQMLRDILCQQTELCIKAEADNAKLRELSSIMLKCIMANERRVSICWECPMHKQFDELRSYCCLEHEAKKMGVEADG